MTFGCGWATSHCCAWEIVGEPCAVRSRVSDDAIKSLQPDGIRLAKLGSSDVLGGSPIGEYRTMSTVFILKGCQRLAGG